MKVLVTGARGFVGSHVARMWSEVMALPPGLDLTEPQALRRFLEQAGQSFDRVLHLAAQSSVADALRDPLSTYRVNFMGSANLMQALSEFEFRGRFLLVSSSSVYGRVGEDELPLTEEQPTRPFDAYAVSKVACEALAFQWAQRGPFEVVVARPVNHIGPGQSERFLVPSMVAQLQAQRNVSQPVLKVGDLDVTRDFLHVEDVVDAYRALLDRGQNGQMYNVASGREVRIGHLVERLVALYERSVSIEIDPERLRGAQQKRVVCSIEKITAATDWRPCRSLDQALRAILNQGTQKVDV